MIARKSALIFLNTVLGGLLGLIAIKAVAAWMDPVIVSRVAYPIGLLGIFFYITDLGFAAAHVKRVSEGMDEADCFATFAVYKAVTTAVFILIALAIFYVQVVVRGVGFQDIALTAYMLIIGYYTLQATRNVFISTFDARRESARAQFAMLGDTIARVGVTVFVAAVYAGVRGTGPLAGVVTADVALFRLIAHYPSGALAFTFVAGMVASLGVAWWQWHRSGATMGRFRWRILKSYWEFALPIFLLGIIGTLATNMDRAALGYFGGDADAGIYEMPRRFTTLLEAIPYAVAALLFPTISAMHARGEANAIRDTTERSLRYISMVTLPIVVFTILFARPLISIFISNEWLRAAPALGLLAAYTYVIGMIRPYYALVSGVGRSDIAAKVGILAAVSNVVFDLVLIPKDIKSLGITLFGLGPTGAALGTLLAGLLAFAYMRVSVAKLKEPVRARDFFRHLGAAALMAAALAALHHGDVHPFVRWYDFILYTVVGGLVYLLGLLAFRGFTRDDWEFFLGLTSARAMLRYVRTELFHRENSR